MPGLHLGKLASQCIVLLQEVGGLHLLVHVLSREFCYLGAHHAVSAIVAMLFTFHRARAFTFHLSGESARHCSVKFTLLTASSVFLHCNNLILSTFHLFSNTGNILR